MIGLVLPEMHNPVFPAFAQAVSGALARLGFTTSRGTAPVPPPLLLGRVRRVTEACRRREDWGAVLPHHFAGAGGGQ